jgi:putative protease
MQPVELLAPAGSPEALDAAVAAGADAVYLGLKSFNARMRSSNFAYSQFEGALRTLHRMGRKVYVTVNTVFEAREGDRMYQLLKYLAATGPDGVIVQDFGTAQMARTCFPSLRLHASTQMNIASARGVNFLSKQGFSRVVLARELKDDEVRTICGSTNMAIEVFVHGALCVSQSGLCLFSSYLGGKSANRGMCTQACRRLYQTASGKGYYFSPCDLSLAEHIPGLIAAGVSAFKIEGRMKSAEYVGTVVSAYRKILDSGSTEEARRLLAEDFARPKTGYFIAGAAPADYLKGDQSGGVGIFLGTVLKVKQGPEGLLGLVPCKDISPGDSLRIHRADDSARKAFKVKRIDGNGEWGMGNGGINATASEPTGENSADKKDSLTKTPLPTHHSPLPTCFLPLPDGFGVGDSVFLIQRASGRRRVQAIVPADLSPYRRSPGRDRAPAPPPLRGKGLFAEGVYAAVSRIEDLYPLQSKRPAGVIFYFHPDEAAAICKGGLPFGPKELIPGLDPFFPEADEGALAEAASRLLDAGYRRFVVNNPGHLSLFRGSEAALIGGPYLYAFNPWARQFLSEAGLAALVSPLENNRQNLERTFPKGQRDNCFVPVFAYPALFRMRESLRGVCDFGEFFDSTGERFRLAETKHGARVFPDAPFSIVDKIPFLREAGFRRFIADFSGPPLRKRDYRTVMEAVENGRPLAGVTRFNWKDGFYTEPNEKP